MAVGGKLAADEAKAWLPTLSNWLMTRAVKRLPVDLRDRFSEEWAADLGAYPGEIARGLRAAGFLFASWRIAGSVPDSLKAVFSKFKPESDRRRFASLLGAMSGLVAVVLAFVSTYMSTDLRHAPYHGLLTFVVASIICGCVIVLFGRLVLSRTRLLDKILKTRSDE